MKEKTGQLFKAVGKKIKNFMTPARYIALGFLGVIAVGTILLVLPFSSASGKTIGFVPALFTSTTAVCVTGLTVIDPATQLSIFGQIVVLLLIQIGGLGFMTTTTFMFMLVGKKISLKERMTIQESLDQDSLKGVVKLTKRIIAFTFIFEGFGTLMLMTRLVPALGARGIYVSLFTAVSSFCNAGIDIMGKDYGAFSSISAFSHDPVVLITVMVLIISGGLGFLVFNDVLRKKRNRPLRLHTRVSLSMTAILLVVGAAVILGIEWNNPGTLGPMDWGDKVLNAFFQSTTARTAGWTSIDQANLTDGAKVATMVLMFVGACPASTGGGVKTTTIFVMIMLFASVFRGRDEVVVGKETINTRTIKRAAVVTTAYFLGSFAQALIIWATEAAYGVRLSVIDSMYEAFSAFGTVGVSAGLTTSLHTPALITLCFSMFIGRLGPLTIGTALLNTKKQSANIKYPDAKILIG